MELKQIDFTFNFVTTDVKYLLNYNNYLYFFDTYNKKLYNFDLVYNILNEVVTFNINTLFYPFIKNNKLYVINGSLRSTAHDTYLNNLKYQYFDLENNLLSEIFLLNIEEINILSNIINLENENILLICKNTGGTSKKILINLSNNEIISEITDFNLYYNFLVKNYLYNKNILTVAATAQYLSDCNNIYSNNIKIFDNIENKKINDVCLIGEDLYILFNDKISKLNLTTNIITDLFNLDNYDNGKLTYFNKKLFMYNALNKKIEYIDFTSDFNTYTFYDKNKNIIKTFENQPPLKNFKSTLTNDLMFLNLETQISTITYNYITDVNLKGYLINNNYYFKINESYKINVIGDLNFYEVVENEPVKSDTSIIFYKYDNETNKVNKVPDLQQIANITGFILNDFDYINFDIIFKKFNNYLNCNYAFIPSFNNYYFIKITNLNNDTININFNLDVLTTYKNFIYSQKALILRANRFNNYDIADNNILSTTKNNINYIDIDLKNNEFNFNKDIERNIILKLIKPKGVLSG